MVKQLVLGTIACISVTSALGQEQDSLQENRMKELREVVVNGYIPNTKLRGNAIVTRVQGTPLASSGTVEEMLLKVPGMTQGKEGLEVLGKGTPSIYINGRLLRDKEELKRLQSEEIRDVEVINNPGAQYDATVRAVVRIRTRKQQGEGFGLTFSGSDEQDLRYSFNRPNLRLNMNYRKGAVDVFGGVWYFHQDHRQYSTLEEKTVTSKVFHQEGPYTMTWLYNTLTYTAGTNWQISDNHSVGVRADLAHHLWGKNLVIYDEEVAENGQSLEHLYSRQVSRENKPLGWLTNTYYNGQVGELGIDFNFDFLTTGTDTKRRNQEESLPAGESLPRVDFVHSESGTDSHLYASKLVLSHPIGGGELEAGTEMTFVTRHNTYSIDKARIANTDADITENNIAAFAEYSYDFNDKTSLALGVRYEHTLFDYDDALNQDQLHRSEDEWFPTASFSTAFGPVKTSLSYGLKTNRPSFFAMNDAVTYISRYSMQAGNSKLHNERTQDLTLNVAWRWLLFTTSYERWKNAITQWSYVNDDDAVLIKHINIDRPINCVSAYITANPRVGIWSLKASAGFDKQDLSLDLTDPEAPNGHRRIYYTDPIYSLDAYNTFSLPHDWSFDINWIFQSKGHTETLYNAYNKCRLGLVLQKKCLPNQALTLRVAVLDLLQRNRVYEYADMGYYKLWQNNRYSFHKLYFSAVYRFNATRSKYKGTGAGKEAQSRL